MPWTCWAFEILFLWFEYKEIKIDFWFLRINKWLQGFPKEKLFHLVLYYFKIEKLHSPNQNIQINQMETLHTSVSFPRTSVSMVATITYTMAILRPEKWKTYFRIRNFFFSNKLVCKLTTKWPCHISTKRTSISSALKLIALQVLRDYLCVQSPVYHELALRSWLQVHLHRKTIAS
jgi:hypothetical protein